ncbi:MAG: hypothetical protein RIF46_03920, partial [Cyclobacteriaceae bacterium]
VIGAVKGLTYNLTNGKIETTKLGKDGIFDSQENKYWKEMKVSLPKVRVGSVIDLTYSITSPYLFNYRDWQFQYSIPAVWSEYRASFIEYYKYQQLMQGYLTPDVIETSSGQTQFTVRTDAQVGVGGGGQYQSGSTDTYSADVTNYRWAIKNVPAFYDEPHLTSRENYVSKINFQLVGQQWPNRPYENLLGSWDKVNEVFSQSESFYKKVSGSNFLQKEVDEIIARGNHENDIQKASAIHSYLISNVGWNGFNSTSSNNAFRKVLSDKKGSVADINLMLTSMLQKAGLNAEPVLISTRNHGFVRPQYPIVDQFNYVICRLIIDNKQILIDATDSFSPFGAIPERCLNGQGLAITPNGASWVDIVPSYEDSEKIVLEATLKDDVLVGTLERRYLGYAARNARAKFISDSTDFKDDFTKVLSWETSNMKTNDFLNFTNSPVVATDFSLDIESTGSLIYLSPVFIKKWSKNPFKLESRDYPVDFSAPKSFTYYLSLKLPQGVTIEDIPESKLIALPNNGGTFRYTVGNQNSHLTVLCKLDLNKVIFVQNEYPYLKEFFEQMIELQNQIIVLKKT